MARMDPTIKRGKREGGALSRKLIVGIGAAFLVLGVVTLGLALWEAFGGASKVRVVDVPGFHELKLDEAGAYVGLYQHRGATPIPHRELARLDVRVMSKGDYQEVPVLMNSGGQYFSRMGMQGMPVFNFVAPRAGTYTLSAVYLDETPGPNVSILVFNQAVQNIKQTLAVGALCFLFFAAVGVWIIVKSRAWAGLASEKN